MKKKIAILGSTGSVGRQTLDVIRKDKKNFKILLLTANKNHRLLLKQIKEFKVKNVIITNNKSYLILNKRLKKVNRVSGFLGAANRPVALRKDEAERILNQIQEGLESVVPTITFEVGETVKVSDGPFASFNGVVEEVDADRSRLKVAVSIFGRATPVELEYTQVEKSWLIFNYVISSF